MFNHTNKMNPQAKITVQKRMQSIKKIILLLLL